jgi:predicted nucleic acid-binding protein
LNIYVESNFVLELALLQEQHASCERLLALCEAGKIQVIVPAYSIMEPYETLLRRDIERRSLKNTLDRELRQLARTSIYSQRLSGLKASTELLIDSNEEEIQRLEMVRARILSCATVIALDVTILGDATRWQALGLAAKDAVVLASVLSHLGSGTESRSCFLTRDADFDDPKVVEQLKARRCKLISRFDSGLSNIEATVSSPT